MGYVDDIQRSFYSAYPSGHGLKAQVLLLSNGMIGSLFLGSWRESDSGLLNMSGLDTYLSNLFREHNMEMPKAEYQFPAIYGD